MFDPWKASVEFKYALDGSFDEKYQWKCFRECHSLFIVVGGAATPFCLYPIPEARIIQPPLSVKLL